MADEFTEAVEWAKANGLWELARMVGRQVLLNNLNIDEIGSSDISCAAVNVVRRWMRNGTSELERTGVITMGFGGRIAGVNLDRADIEGLALSEGAMATTTGGIAAGPNGDYGWGTNSKSHALSMSWGSKGRRTHKEAPADLLQPPPRRIGVPEEPVEEPPVVEPAPEPRQKQRTKQLIVGEKEPFLERLERYLSANLGEMEQAPLIATLTGQNDAGIGPKAKEIQQRVEMDNAQRRQAVKPADSEAEEQDEE